MQRDSEIPKTIARGRNVTDAREALIWVGSLLVNVEVEVGVRKTTVKSFMMMKE